MIFDIFLLVVGFMILCMGNGCVIYFIWWIIGQPMPVDRDIAQYAEGRILSSVGRKLCEWYMRYAEQQEDEIIAKVAANSYESEKERSEAYYHLSKKRKPNPAKAFGVCPICFGTYITLIVNTGVVILVGMYFGWIVAACTSIPIIVYGWAISLAFLKEIFLSD